MSAQPNQTAQKTATLQLRPSSSLLCQRLWTSFLVQGQAVCAKVSIVGRLISELCISKMYKAQHIKRRYFAQQQSAQQLLNSATGVLSCLSTAFTGSAAAYQPVAFHILSALLAAKTSVVDVHSALYITSEGSSPRELLSSTTGGLASVIDAALGMLLGSETSGTAAHLFGVFAMVMSVVSCNFASTPRASCIQQVLKLYRQFCVGLSRHLVNMLVKQ